MLHLSQTMSWIANAACYISSYSVTHLAFAFPNLINKADQELYTQKSKKTVLRKAV